MNVFVELTAFWCESGAVWQLRFAGIELPQACEGGEPDASGIGQELVLANRATEDVS